MSHDDTDLIELLAGIRPGSPVAALRDRRSQARENAQRSFSVLLEPAEPSTSPIMERYAIAYFTALLHDFAPAAELYGDLFGDEAPELVDVITTAGEAARTTGPYGHYREPGLAAESVPGPVWTADPDAAAALGDRLAAGLGHTHLLVFRPRESTPAALRTLVDAGWSADDIVRLSQLIAFLTFQLRTAAGLRALHESITEGVAR